MKNRPIIFPKSIKAIFFDLDNTLINRDQAFEYYLIHFFKQQNQLETWSKNKKEILIKDNHGYTKRTDFFNFLTQKFVSKEAFLAYQKENLVADFVEEISKELVEKISKLNEIHLLGIMTNGGKENQLKKIQKAGLKSLFLEEQIFISGEIGFQKPEKSFFHFVEKKMQLLSNQCLLIGDDEKNDISGGKDANWCTHHTNYQQILSEL